MIARFTIFNNIVNPFNVQDSSDRVWIIMSNCLPVLQIRVFMQGFVNTLQTRIIWKAIIEKWLLQNRLTEHRITACDYVFRMWLYQDGKFIASLPPLGTRVTSLYIGMTYLRSVSLLKTQISSSFI